MGATVTLSKNSGRERGVGALGVVDGVEVVHVVAAHDEEERPQQQLQGVCRAVKIPH